MQQQPSPFDLQRIVRMALFIVLRPTQYFRTMPRSGNLAEPIVFTMVLSLLGVLLLALMALPSGQLPVLTEIFLVPGLVCACAFVVAFVLMLLWKLLGSKQSYATAFRCVAATTAIIPLTSLLAFVPNLSLFLNAFWSLYLLYLASLHVHEIGRGKSLALLALLSAILGGSLWANYSFQALVREQRLQLGTTEEAYKAMSPEERMQIDQQVLERLRQQQRP